MSDHSTHNEGHGHHDDHGHDNSSVNPTQFEIPVVLGGLIWVLIFMFLNICTCKPDDAKKCAENCKEKCEQHEGAEHH